jgi:hypothetical protein
MAPRACLEYQRTSPAATEIPTGLSPAQAAELTRQARHRLVSCASAGGVTMPGAAWLVAAQAARTGTFAEPHPPSGFTPAAGAVRLS